jgi:pimeloyl-ACP methyl ester carboxylesterase
MLGKLTRLGALYNANGQRTHVGEKGSKISFLAARSPRRGVAKTILLIHGAGMSARSWALQLRGLSPGCQVLAMDLPGHGASDPIADASVERYAESASTLLTTWDRTVFVAGHSLGGSVGLVAAIVRAGEGPRLDLELRKDATEQRCGKALLGCCRCPSAGCCFRPREKFPVFALGPPTAPSSSRSGTSQLPPRDGQDMAAEAMNLDDIAQNLRTPTLILCGTSDIVTPLRLSEKLNDLIPGARLHVVDQAGHMLPLEAPERVNQEIMEFVAGVEEDKARQSGSVVGAAKRHIGRLVADRIRRLCRG